MRWPRLAVKQRQKSREVPQLRRHWLRGWPLAIPVFGIAAVSAALAFPRPVRPRMLPEPMVSRPVVASEVSTLRALSDRARHHPLPRVVRAAGEAYRQLCIATLLGAEVAGNAPRQRFMAAVQRARRAVGDAPVLELRAVQAQLFVDALARFDREHRTNRDLDELGGDFLQTAKSKGWIDSQRLRASTEERWALFVLHWTERAGLGNRGPFRPATELRVLALRLALSRGYARANDLQRDLESVARLAELDLTYPADLARGVVYARYHQWPSAARSFVTRLRAYPDGPYALLARNYLLYSAERARELSTSSTGPVPGSP